MLVSKLSCICNYQVILFLYIFFYINMSVLFEHSYVGMV